MSWKAGEGAVILQIALQIKINTVYFINVNYNECEVFKYKIFIIFS